MQVYEEAGRDWRRVDLATAPSKPLTAATTATAPPRPKRWLVATDIDAFPRSTAAAHRQQAPIEHAIRWATRCVQGILAGALITLLVVVAQFPADGGSSLIATVAPFAPSLRFFQSVLTTVAWVGAATAFLQLRAAQLALQRDCLAATSDTASYWTPSQTLSFLPGRLRSALALGCYTTVMLSLWAAMPCDYHIRGSGDGSAPDDTGPCTAAWRSLLIIRCVASVVGWAAASQRVVEPLELATWLGPSPSPPLITPGGERGSGGSTSDAADATAFGRLNQC